MNARALCHHCGADIALDAPILLNEFSMRGAGWPLCWNNLPLKLTNGEAAICWALMKAYPEAVRHHVLLERLDSAGLNNMLNVMVCRIRAKLRALGATDPIESVWGIGYRWKMARPVVELTCLESLTVAHIQQAFRA